MTDALRVYVGEGAEELVDVELDFEDGHGRLHLVEVSAGAVNCLGDEFLHEIEVHLILLFCISMKILSLTVKLTLSPLE